MNYNLFNSRIAKKYALAFMRVFGRDLTYTDMNKLQECQEFVSTHRRMLFFLQLQNLDNEQKRSMIEDFIGYFSLPQQLFRLLLLLIEHNRAFYIPGVFFFIGHLYGERLGIARFSVMSSHELNDEQREKIKQFLSRKTGKTIVCSYMVKKNLIAGMRMQSVDYMWEYSVRKQLASLQTFRKIGAGA